MHPEIVNKWCTQNKDLPEIKKNVEELKKLHDDMMKNMEMNHPGFKSDLPERLTVERYIRIY